MNLYDHAKICLLASALALLAVALGILPALTHVVASEWAFAALCALIASYFVAQLLAANQAGPVSGEDRIDQAPPALAAMALMTIWTPVLLAVGAVALLAGFDVAPQKAGWILVALAGMVGQHLANLKRLRDRP